MQDYFFALAQRLCSSLPGGEVLLLAFDGEESDFVRFNRGRVLQAGSVLHRRLAVDLIERDRHARGRARLSGRLEQDLPRLSNLLAELRQRRSRLSADPYLNFSADAPSGETLLDTPLPDPDAAVAAITAAAGSLDLVGIWAAGRLHTGFASSLGQRNWHSRASFNFDWSCHHAADKAVKATYAGTRWDPAELDRKLAAVRRDLEAMARPARTIAPGGYRVYLAPRALQEILDMMAWDGFALKAHRTGQSPLRRMVADGVRLAPGVCIDEDHVRGLAPPFTPEGFLKPERITLIDQGMYRDCLADARSAREYGVGVNAAGESPESLAMSGGSLAAARVLEALDTGLYINNLWYLNYSDRNQARITGMTRFACFWVEAGEIRAPVNVMRFDDSVYNLLGEKLLGLTRERELWLDPDSYEGRSSRSFQTPGALVEEMRFTL